MGIILVVSFIFIVAIGLTNHEEFIRSIRSGSTNLKIGIFTLITGIIILLSGEMLGFGRLRIINEIISICFLVAFLCLIIGIFKFINLTSFSFNRKLGVFSLINGFTFAVIARYFPIFNTLLPANFRCEMITLIFYIAAVFSLIVEVYKFIFNSKSQNEKIN